jgi:mRNA interferase RelE/StbE
MTFEVRIDRHADRALASFPPSVANRLTNKMAMLKVDPMRPRPRADIKRLHDKAGVFRLRVGDYRIFYSVYRNEKVVVVTDIRHRSHAHD